MRWIQSHRLFAGLTAFALCLSSGAVPVLADAQEESGSMSFWDYVIFFAIVIITAVVVYTVANRFAKKR